MDPKISIQFEITNLGGEKKQYFLQPLKRKTAAHVAHTFLQTLFRGLSKAGRAEDEDKQSAVLDAIASIEFETLWGLASELLRNSTIQQGVGKPIIQIDTLENTDYFEDNPDELYQAVFFGVKENFPKVFSRVRASLRGFGQPRSDKMTSDREMSSTA